MNNSGESLGIVAMFGVAFLFIAAWVTHIAVCIMQGAWFLLLAGAIFFPVGIVHGVLTWFGMSVA